MKRSKRIELAAEARTLKKRIERGMDVCFEAEQRGEIGGEYPKNVALLDRLITDYDALTKSMILHGKTHIEVA